MERESPVRVIAGDIGGTKTLMQLVAFDPRVSYPRGEVLAETRYTSREHPDLRSIVRAFRAEIGEQAVYAACLGVAGPVQDLGDHQHARLTNLPWEPDSRQLAEVLGIGRVRLINDFQAVGYGIDALAPADLAQLQERPAQPGAPRLVLGAGTGLGVALLFQNGPHYDCWPTEGGHTHFAPLDEEQDALLRYLRAEHGRVSCERLVSGPGLVNIYRFLLSLDPMLATSDRLLGLPDPAAAITAEAAAGDPTARHALTLFVAIYGAVAGDLALTCLPAGGVYIAGGIAPKILSHMASGGFMAAFTDKGRMRPLLEHLPVQVVLNDRVGLLGTALAASRM